MGLALAATRAAWRSCRRLQGDGCRAEGTTRVEGRAGSEVASRPARGGGRPATASSGCDKRPAGPATETEAGLDGACAESRAHAQCGKRGRLFPGGAGRGGDARSGLSALRPADFRLSASGTHGLGPGSTLALPGGAPLGPASVVTRSLAHAALHGGGGGAGGWGRPRDTWPCIGNPGVLLCGTSGHAIHVSFRLSRGKRCLQRAGQPTSPDVEDYSNVDFVL